MAATVSAGSTAVAVASAFDAPGRDDDLLDEAYLRFHATGPEYQGSMSNHGPMAVDALLRLGAADLVADWVRRYARRLEPAPAERWPITGPEWREPLGDPSRLGDWLMFFARTLADDHIKRIRQPDHGTRRRRLGRPDLCMLRSIIQHPLNQNLDLAACFLYAEETRFQYPRIVEDKEVASVQQ